MGQLIQGLTPDRSRIRPKSRPARRRHPWSRGLSAGAPPRLGKGHPSSAARRSDPPLTELAPLSPRGRGVDDPHPGSRISLTSQNDPKRAFPAAGCNAGPHAPGPPGVTGGAGGLVSLDGAAFANNLRRRLAVDPRCGGCGRDRRGRYRPVVSSAAEVRPFRSFVAAQVGRLRLTVAFGCGGREPIQQDLLCRRHPVVCKLWHLPAREHVAIRRSPLRLHESNRSR